MCWQANGKRFKVHRYRCNMYVVIESTLVWPQLRGTTPSAGLSIWSSHMLTTTETSVVASTKLSVWSACRHVLRLGLIPLTLQPCVPCQHHVPRRVTFSWAGKVPDKALSYTLSSANLTLNSAVGPIALALPQHALIQSREGNMLHHGMDTCGTKQWFCPLG